MKLEIGNLEIELRKPTAFEAVGFVPLFSRYLDVLNEVNQTYQKQLQNAKTDEEKEKVLKAMQVSKERLLTSYFGSFDKFTQQELLKYISKLIEKWSFEVDPTPENLSKLPPLVLLLLFDNVAVLTLLGDENNLDFFESIFTKPDEKVEKE